jgi:hypothetical protein
MRRLPPRWRAHLGIRLASAARTLLDADKPHNGDFDTCIYCRQPGCEDGTVEHTNTCPSTTGLYPVDIKSLWPHGPSRCNDCREPLMPGDHYTNRQCGDIAGTPIFEIVCVGCAARTALL